MSARDVNTLARSTGAPDVMAIALQQPRQRHALSLFDRVDDISLCGRDVVGGSAAVPVGGGEPHRALRCCRPPDDHASITSPLAALSSRAFWLLPRPMEILRGLALSATGMRSRRTPSW